MWGLQVFTLACPLCSSVPTLTHLGISLEIFLEPGVLSHTEP
jgi:hypothetical protein